MWPERPKTYLSFGLRFHLVARCQLGMAEDQPGLIFQQPDTGRFYVVSEACFMRHFLEAKA